MPHRGNMDELNQRLARCEFEGAPINVVTQIGTRIVRQSCRHTGSTSRYGEPLMRRVAPHGKGGVRGNGASCRLPTPRVRKERRLAVKRPRLDAQIRGARRQPKEQDDIGPHLSQQCRERVLNRRIARLEHMRNPDHILESRVPDGGKLDSKVGCGVEAHAGKRAEPGNQHATGLAAGSTSSI